jgi:hypothetical protein
MKKRTCKQCGKSFKPLNEKQEDCSELCLANRFDTFTKKTRALARILAGTMGYRSMSEVRFAARLNDADIPFGYETEILKYQYNPQKYVVDFTLEIDNTHKILLEYKGKLDGPSRKKMRAVKAANPDMDIRFVFEKPNNKLYKGAKLRYWEWAERYGFKWYDAIKDIDTIKRHIKELNNVERKKSKTTKASSKSQAKQRRAPKRKV